MQPDIQRNAVQSADAHMAALILAFHLRPELPCSSGLTTNFHFIRQILLCREDCSLYLFLFFPFFRA